MLWMMIGCTLMGTMIVRHLTDMATTSCATHSCVLNWRVFKFMPRGKSLNGGMVDFAEKRRWHGCCYDSIVFVSAMEI